MTDTSEEAARRRAAEQLSAATAAMVTQGNIEAERAEQEKKAKKEAKRKVGCCCGMYVYVLCREVGDCKVGVLCLFVACLNALVANCSSCILLHALRLAILLLVRSCAVSSSQLVSSGTPGVPLHLLSHRPRRRRSAVLLSVLPSRPPWLLVTSWSPQQLSSS